MIFEIITTQDWAEAMSSAANYRAGIPIARIINICITGSRVIPPMFTAIPWITSGTMAGRTPEAPRIRNIRAETRSTSSSEGSILERGTYPHHRPEAGHTWTQLSRPGPSSSVTGDRN